MKIDLERLGDEPFTWQETVAAPTDLPEHPDRAAVGEVACDGRLARLASGFLLRLALAYDQTVRCTRCLSETAAPADLDSEFLILVDQHDDSAGERELEGDELGVIHLGEPILDTHPLILEQLELNTPMKPLCRPDCAGLCSRCGADLNRETCTCKAEADPRWAALSALKD